MAKGKGKQSYTRSSGIINRRGYSIFNSERLEETETEPEPEVPELEVSEQPQTLPEQASMIASWGLFGLILLVLSILIILFLFF